MGSSRPLIWLVAGTGEPYNAQRSRQVKPGGTSPDAEDPGVQHVFDISGVYPFPNERTVERDEDRTEH